MFEIVVQYDRSKVSFSLHDSTSGTSATQSRPSAGLANNSSKFHRCPSQNWPFSKSENPDEI